MAQEVSSSSSKPNMVLLKTFDNIIFEVEATIVKEMQTIYSFIDGNTETNAIATTSTAIPLPNVSSNHLRMIIDYLQQRSVDDEAKAKEFDAEFVKAVITDELVKLLLATHYLNVKGLSDYLTDVIADRMKNMSVEDVRSLFKIKNDFTPEEEAKIREENAWVFEKVDEDN